MERRLDRPVVPGLKKNDPPSSGEAADRACWQRRRGLEADITRLLHVWADPHAGTETHDNMRAVTEPAPPREEDEEHQGDGRSRWIWLDDFEGIVSETFIIFFLYSGNSNHRASKKENARKCNCMRDRLVSSVRPMETFLPALPPSWVNKAAAAPLFHCCSVAVHKRNYGEKKTTTLHSPVNQLHSNALCSLHVHCQRKAHFLRRCFTLNAPQWRDRLNVNSRRVLFGRRRRNDTSVMSKSFIWPESRENIHLYFFPIKCCKATAQMWVFIVKLFFQASSMWLFFKINVSFFNIACCVELEYWMGVPDRSFADTHLHSLDFILKWVQVSRSQLRSQLWSQAATSHFPSDFFFINLCCFF